MPRDPRPGTSVAQIPHNSMVASAMRFEGGKVDNAQFFGVKEWQAECYRQFEICGEARFAAAFFGNAMSRATLGVGKMQPGFKIGPGSTKAEVVLSELFNGSSGQAAMLASLGVHLTIAGEAWLVGRKVGGVDTWEIVSVLEMRKTGDRLSIEYGENRQMVELGASDVAIRIWTPHPARRIEADSPFRSMLPILQEIERMTLHIFAQTRSRLASAGIFAIPAETTFPEALPGADQTTAAKNSNELDNFMRMLAAAMSANLTNYGDAAALVPIFMKMPGDQIKNLKLLKFWSELDAKAMEMRSNDLQRFYQGMDLPVEQMQGIGSSPGTGGGRSTGVSHWGGWQIEEQTIKMHIEPKLEVVANSLALEYLRPLTGDNDDVVTYSTEALRGRPDRSESSIVLANNGWLKPEVALKENGFDPTTQMMSKAEREEWLLWKIASGSASPEMILAAQRLLGIDLGVVPNGNSDASTPRETRPDPSTENMPDRPRTPEPPPNLVPVANAIVLRALERAGNRIKQAARRAEVPVPDVPSYATHTVYACNGSSSEFLADAFSTAPLLLADVTDHPDEVVLALHSYCLDLLQNRTPHTKDRMAAALAEAGC